MKIHRSPACNRKLSKWLCAPKDSAEYRLAGFAYRCNDFEVRDKLDADLAEYPADSDEVRVARELRPLLVVTDPPHDPPDLLDELDALVRDQELLRLRAVMLAAKYRALEPHSDLWDNYPADDPEFGEMNIRATARALESVSSMLSGYVSELFTEARTAAAKVRPYDITAAVLP